MTKSAKARERATDLTGLQFGKLIVLSRNGRKGLNAAWLCRCECGVELTVNSARLVGGTKTHCGCSRPPKPLKYDLTISMIERMCIPEPNSGCWLWLGPTTPAPNGDYARVTQNGRAFRVSRLVYELYKGPLGDLFACHRCDNPLCVNPDHIFAGTPLDNTRDMVSKGRNVRGVASPMAILNDEIVAAILLDRRPSKEVASEHGVDGSLVRRIRRGEVWRHVPRPAAASMAGGFGDESESQVKQLEEAYHRKLGWLLGVGA